MSAAVPSEMVLFLDTNSLLHYPPLKDVDWLDVAQSKRVRLALCMQVIDELDEKKSDPRLGKRADSSLKEIERYLESTGEVKKHVSFEIYAVEIRDDDFPPSLNPRRSDDRIVYSVIQFMMANPGSRVAVYSEDTGMRIRCKGHGVEVLKPNPETRKENTQDEAARKLKETQVELNELKNRLPRLRVVLASAGARPPDARIPLEVQIQDIPPELDKEKQLNEYKRANGLFPLKNPDEKVGSILHVGYVKEELKEYNLALGKHLEEYAEWLRRSSIQSRKNARRIDFSLWICNDGSAPSDDVTLNVTIANSLTILLRGADATQYFGTPHRPTQPTRPKLRPGGIDITRHLLGSKISGPSALGVDRMTWEREFRTEMIPLSNPEIEFLYGKPKVISRHGESTHRIEVFARRIQHHESFHVGDFAAEVASTQVTPFAMTYRLTGTHQPKPLEDELIVILKSQ